MIDLTKSMPHVHGAGVQHAGTAARDTTQTFVRLAQAEVPRLGARAQRAKVMARLRQGMAALLRHRRRAAGSGEAGRYPEGLLQYYGSIEAYLEEQRRCAVYAMDRELRERRAA